jgi:hypothetical protein
MTGKGYYLEIFKERKEDRRCQERARQAYHT